MRPLHFVRPCPGAYGGVCAWRPAVEEGMAGFVTWAQGRLGAFPLFVGDEGTTRYGTSRRGTAPSAAGRVVTILMMATMGTST